MTLLVGCANESIFDTTTIEAMFRFRHRIFHDRLGWDVHSELEMEFDIYDHLRPHYMIAKDGEDDVKGCWRFLPTTGPYMLRDTFPVLLQGQQAPRQDNIWELSRFAVDEGDCGMNGQVQMHGTTMEMIRQVVYFAKERNIDHYVTVTSVSLERMLRRAGIPMRRFGNGRATRIGKVLTIACWIDVSDLAQAVLGDKWKVAA